MSILKSTNIGRSTFEVDLGLSVNWCSCNLGASAPEDYGHYFAWGDTKGYKESEITNDMFDSYWYKQLGLNLFCANINADAEWQRCRDAAREYLKGKWRMPTLTECKELILKTYQEEDVVNGVSGIRFTGPLTCNSIFIPYSGAMCMGLQDKTKEFHLWTSDINPNDNGQTCNFSGYGYGQAMCNIIFRNRYHGLSIRAVIAKS